MHCQSMVQLAGRTKVCRMGTKVSGRVRARLAFSCSDRLAHLAFMSSHFLFTSSTSLGSSCASYLQAPASSTGCHHVHIWRKAIKIKPLSTWATSNILFGQRLLQGGHLQADV